MRGVGRMGRLRVVLLLLLLLLWGMVGKRSTASGRRSDLCMANVMRVLWVGLLRCRGLAAEGHGTLCSVLVLLLLLLLLCGMTSLLCVLAVLLIHATVLGHGKGSVRGGRLGGKTVRRMLLIESRAKLCWKVLKRMAVHLRGRVVITGGHGMRLRLRLGLSLCLLSSEHVLSSCLFVHLRLLSPQLRSLGRRGFALSTAAAAAATAAGRSSRSSRSRGGWRACSTATARPRWRSRGLHSD